MYVLLFTNVVINVCLLQTVTFRVDKKLKEMD